jgi:hypothetical protein
LVSAWGISAKSIASLRGPVSGSVRHLVLCYPLIGRPVRPALFALATRSTADCHRRSRIANCRDALAGCRIEGSVKLDDIIFVGSKASALALTVTHSKCELSVDSPKYTEFGRASAGGRLGICTELRRCRRAASQLGTKDGFCTELRGIDLSDVGAVAKLLLEVSGGLLNRYTG